MSLEVTVEIDCDVCGNDLMEFEANIVCDDCMRRIKRVAPELAGSLGLVPGRHPTHIKMRDGWYCTISSESFSWSDDRDPSYCPVCGFEM